MFKLAVIEGKGVVGQFRQQGSTRLRTSWTRFTLGHLRQGTNLSKPHLLDQIMTQ